ncbi:MAG: SDR family oxidoreductase [Xanthomonadaceae bacterium]|nr:SDR family oxidoreductase [Xanthomonadaceae bacterium]
MNRVLLLAIPFLCCLVAAPAVAEPTQTVLITGANRGIGLEYARQFAAKGYRVIGTARNPAEAGELAEVADRVEALDVADGDSVAALARRLDGLPIDILINNAGIFDRSDTTIDAVDFARLEQTFAVNTFGPLRVAQALMPNLRAGGLKRIVSMSSQLGSIERSTGQWYAYRSSKAALNQINRTLAAELGEAGFVCVVLHPGWVRTDMGGENATNSPEHSVRALIALIEGFSAEDNGQFYDFQGASIPW